MAQISYLDNILKEYLAFRGFSNTAKALENEQKNEKEQSFRAEKIVEQFVQHIQSYDLAALLALWTHLDCNLFSKLEHTYAQAVKKLENSLLKFYLINAYANNRQDKITEFFNKLAVDLQQQSEWKEWFFLPFCQKAEESVIFSQYFTKQWQDTLLLSLRNFLTTIYQCLPQPTFVRAEQEAAFVRRLQEENTLLKSRLQQLNTAAAAGSSQNLSSSTASATEAGTRMRRNANRSQQSLNDIIPFDVSPPGHVVDDFCIIASEVNNLAQASDVQTRGLKMLIRQIGSGNSPTLIRKDTAGDNSSKNSKRRSGSVGRSWM